MDINELIRQDPKQQLFSAVRGLPSGTIFIGNTDNLTSSFGPRELFDAAQAIENPMSYKTQAHIVLAYRAQNGQGGPYRVTD